MHYDSKIECWDPVNVDLHKGMAYLPFNNFRFRQCHLAAQEACRTEVAFQAEVLPVLLDVRQFLFASHVSADSMLCHFGMEGSRSCDFYKP